MNNLIDTWLESERSIGNTQAEAIRQMNKVLETNYTSSRVNEWRRGVRNPDAVAHRYMVMNALPYAMMKVDRDMFKRLNEMETGDLINFTWRLTKAITLSA